MFVGDPAPQDPDMTRYRLHHSHTAAECAAAFAAWRGFASPLRRTIATSSCAGGGHELWFDVEADSAVAALAMLPGFVAARTAAIPVHETPIP